MLVQDADAESSPSDLQEDELFLAVENFAWCIPKATNFSLSWTLADAAVGGQSETSTDCLSATPSSFNDVESSQTLKFWL
mmetsp:Transcript_51662/g.115898  ORF Transcript_51662/g.115898 Transcript_51662/m.115898 type:complete len:80 (+) Transcript_51662:2-241(+)